MAPNWDPQELVRTDTPPNAPANEEQAFVARLMTGDLSAYEELMEDLHDNEAIVTIRSGGRDRHRVWIGTMAVEDVDDDGNLVQYTDNMYLDYGGAGGTDIGTDWQAGIWYGTRKIKQTKASASASVELTMPLEFHDKRLSGGHFDKQLLALGVTDKPQREKIWKRVLLRTWRAYHPHVTMVKKKRNKDQGLVSSNTKAVTGKQSRNDDQAPGQPDDEQTIEDSICSDWGVDSVQALWELFNRQPQQFLESIEKNEGLANAVAQGAVDSLSGCDLAPMTQKSLVKAAFATIEQNLAQVSLSASYSEWLNRASTGAKGRVTTGTKRPLQERALMKQEQSKHEEKRLRREEKQQKKLRKEKKKRRKEEKRHRKEEKQRRKEGKHASTSDELHGSDDADEELEEKYTRLSRSQRKHSRDQASSTGQDGAPRRKKGKSSRSKARAADDEDEDEAEAEAPTQKKPTNRKHHHLTPPKDSAYIDEDEDEDEDEDQGQGSSYKESRTTDQMSPAFEADLEALDDFQVAAA